MVTNQSVYDEMCEVYRKFLWGELVEVTRCKDCKRWKNPRDYECPYHTSGDPYIDDDPEEDFFCKLGKRRDR